MTIQEHSLWLHGEGFDMLGIVSRPAEPLPLKPTGVVIVVGGAQYRVGSHRQFLQLARRLAEHGFAVLRFDLPGMGDSPGELPSFEDTSQHIGAAIDGLQRQCPGLDRVVLWGLCDGASASLLYVEATHDPRMAGLALLNPWVRNEQSLARARVKHYYRQRLLEPDFWHKLLRGGMGWSALKRVGANLRRAQGRRTAPAGFQDRMAQGWADLAQPILLLLSERDLTAQEFVDHASAAGRWLKPPGSGDVTRVTIAGADHTCSHPSARIEAENATLAWLLRL